MEMDTYRIGFIGAGNLTRSLIGGLMSSGALAPHILCHDRHPEKMDYLSNRYQIQSCKNSLELAEQVDILVLSVKPKDIQSVVESLQEIFKKRACLLVSTAIGITTQKIQQWLTFKNPIIRAMPNTPALLQSGATGLYANLQVNEEQKNLSETVFRSVGTTVWLNHEHDIDTVSLLSGSGPAYFLYLMEILQQCGESLGLSSHVAKTLTTQTALGAARLALGCEKELSDLMEQIATPGGITEKALEKLRSGNFDESIRSAFLSAKERLKKISDTFEEN